ncbi:hypothetical protein BKA82DRAFT_20657 [Pisolithus tinctorius]|uniref:Uncharacterized protein n=1 Tax=Pisolithus tinctorius Marx 270 TaxID=870435 RepID=A0A0C3PRD6_PISTI|nr:hypothetical protein BKA82DRAFT_20657 [Pisolithus tinctorius]KIO11159.1 hypothetical protein M404DRAFT_20657 [Pisolithus tinctorius Marx 270]
MSFTNTIFPSMPPMMSTDSLTKLPDFASRWTNAHVLTTPPLDGNGYDLKYWLEHWNVTWADIDSLAKEASSEQLEILSTDEVVSKLLREAQ